jgi:integrase
MRKSRESSRAGATFRVPSRSGKDLMKKTLETLMKEYVLLKQHGTTKKSADAVETTLTEVVGPLKTRAPREVSPELLAQHLAAWCEGRMASTAKQGARHVKGFWTWLRRKKNKDGTYVIPDGVRHPWEDDAILTLLETLHDCDEESQPQFTVEETVKLREHMLSHAHDDVAAMVALVCLDAGLRFGEVLGITARAVDSGGTVVWVGLSTRKRVKNKNAKRPARISEDVAELLLRWRGDLTGDTFLFPYTQEQLRERIYEHYKLAGVPVLTVHALRRTFSTLRVLCDDSYQRTLSKEMGHSSFQVTRGRYVAPGTVETVEQAKVADLLKRHSPRKVNLG